MMIELRLYRDADGDCPFAEWLERLPDRQARARIQSRLARVAGGNVGDAKSVGGGVHELRIDWGPGYRVYFARFGSVVVLLLCGGDKRTQGKDIRRAKDCLEDYVARTGTAKERR